MKSAKELRKPIYKIVEDMLTRPMTPVEHEQIKSAIQSYHDGQEQRVKEMEATVQRQGSRARTLGRSLYALVHNKGVPEEQIAFLKPLFE